MQNVWFFTNYGFYSVVKRHRVARDDTRELVIRTRRKGWLDELRRQHMPELGVALHEDGRDYQWRAYATREDVARALARLALTLDYENFKSSIRDQDLSWAAHKVWDTMLDAGDGTSVYDHHHLTGPAACKAWGCWYPDGRETCPDCGKPKPGVPKPRKPRKQASAKATSTDRR